MKIARRLYLYAVTLISLETVLWGVIGLARSFFSGGRGTGDATQLAQALSLILVGVPVFLLHGWLAQRSALQDEEERAARVRAVFLYGALLATLIPVVQNLLAVVARFFIRSAGLEAWRAMAGGRQTFLDNLIAIAANLLVAGIIFLFLRRDWSSGIPEGGWRQVRRLYRYIWVVYGLGLSVGGLLEVIQSLLLLLQPAASRDVSAMPNGLALAVVGLPVWGFSEWVVQRSIQKPVESSARLRSIILYGLTLISISSVAAATGILLFEVLLVAFGSSGPLLGNVAEPLAAALTFGAVWFYYGRRLRAEKKSLPQPPHRADLSRLFYSILSFGGLATTFFGLQQLVLVVLEAVFHQTSLSAPSNRGDTASALAALLVGIPLWVAAWRPLSMEARPEGEAGDRARRSVVRKGYLFLVLFASVIGIMFSTGVLIYLFLLPVLGEQVKDLLLQVFQQLRLVLLFGLVLIYHGRILRRDNRLAERALARRHEQFPVLVLVMDGDTLPADSTQPEDASRQPWEEFATTMVNALHRHAPALPVAIHRSSQGAPDEALSAARAVILPAGLVARPSEAIRLWLQSFAGTRLVVPSPTKGWQWVSGQNPLSTLANQAAQTVRQMAEGDPVAHVQEAPGWMWVVYIFAGLFALELIIGLINLIVLAFQ